MTSNKQKTKINNSQSNKKPHKSSKTKKRTIRNLNSRIIKNLLPTDFYQKKGEDLILISSCKCLPKTNLKCSDDSYLITSKVIAIADGVGGWNNVGVDPSLYSKELCSNLKLEVSKLRRITKTTCKNLLCKSASLTHTQGSSTFCVVLLDFSNMLMYSSYIGDSAYMILREIRGKIQCLFKSKEQTHSFNLTYQIGTFGDEPDKALCFTHKIVEKDIIILGSDGLWDNLYVDQILAIVEGNLKNGYVDSAKLADIISKNAKEKSKNEFYLSPFSNRANEEGYDIVNGGKEDDITVIVSQIHRI